MSGIISLVKCDMCGKLESSKHSVRVYSGKVACRKCSTPWTCLYYMTPVKKPLAEMEERR